MVFEVTIFSSFWNAGGALRLLGSNRRRPSLGPRAMSLSLAPFLHLSPLDHASSGKKKEKEKEKTVCKTNSHFLEQKVVISVS